MINEYMIYTFNNAGFIGSFISNAPLWVCFSFCLDTKRNKRSRLCLLSDPLRSQKLKQKKTFTIDILLFLNAFFILRVPRATGKVMEPNGQKLFACVSPSASVAEPLADKRNGRKTKRADRQ